MMFILLSIAVLLAYLSTFFVSSGKTRYLLAYLLPCIYVVALQSFTEALSPWEKLFLASLIFIFVFKIATLFLLKIDVLRSLKLHSILLYSFISPGMDTNDFFTENKNQSKISEFKTAYLFGLFGTALMLVFAVMHQSINQNLLGWIGIVPFLLVLHLGICNVSYFFCRAASYGVQRPFGNLFASQNLRDFWSVNWNRPFVELNKSYFRPLLEKGFGKQTIIIFLFLISGFLHELALSYPVNYGWGGPTIYFLIQGFALITFNKISINQKVERVLTWLIILLPLPLLFNQEFRLIFIVGFYQLLSDFIFYILGDKPLEGVLLILGLFNLICISAGIQLPRVFDWKNEFSKLEDFTRKIITNYYFYVGLMIFAWFYLSVFCREDLLSGTPLANTMLFIMGTFWLIRIFVDQFYFSEEDWPKGVYYEVGHFLLSTVFVILTIGYFALLIIV